MKFFIVILLLHVFSISANAQNYSFETLDLDSFLHLEQNENDEIENSLFCHGEKHIEEYTQYIQSQVIPRLRIELPQLTQIQTDDRGRILKVADVISTGDLFHAHLRVPINPLPTQTQTLNSNFTDPSKFHIQFHSFEIHHLFVAEWKNEILQISNPELRNWMAQVADFEEQQNSMGDPGFGSYNPIDSDLEALSDGSLIKFARLWFDWKYQREITNSQLDQWQLNRLINKLSMIDPKNITGGSRDILKDRSLISQHETFKILPRLNIKGYFQFANIYFTPLDQIPNITELISSATKANISSIYNIDSPKFPRSNFTQFDNDEVHKSLFQDLVAAIDQTQNPNIIFYNQLQDTFKLDEFLVFMWDDKHLYAIRYSLLCD